MTWINQEIFFIGIKVLQNKFTLLPEDFKHVCFQKKGALKIDRFSIDVYPVEDHLFYCESNLCANFLSGNSEISSKNDLTFIEAKLKCKVMADNSIFITRILSRIWFDGSVAYEAYYSFVYTNLDSRWFLKAFKGFPEYLSGVK